ncbi:MAG TPA: MBL fold metallo-hydrolase [Polyangiaceae bacterium]|nr:MBL fold metallo-hydrolase [Polyangiaceae bacterium]
MSVRAIPLQSGSSGNCVFVEAAGVRLLVDAGISGKQTALRLAEHGVDVRTIHAVLLTHDHVDHVMCAHVLQRKFGLPLYATAGTWKVMRRTGRAFADARVFRAGERIRFGAVTVETIPTPHDGADGVIFVVDSGRVRTGVFTDLGHPFAELGPAIESLDGVFLESNYDPEMLASSRYPESVQRRIAGPHGHLSNEESAALLQRWGKRLKRICLAHLSADTNTPRVATGTHRRLGRKGIPLQTAPRDRCGEPMSLG